MRSGAQRRGSQGEEESISERGKRDTQRAAQRKGAKAEKMAGWRETELTEIPREGDDYTEEPLEG